jgi:hypothetical protein
LCTHRSKTQYLIHLHKLEEKSFKKNLAGITKTLYTHERISDTMLHYVVSMD